MSGGGSLGLSVRVKKKTWASGRLRFMRNVKKVLKTLKETHGVKRTSQCNGNLT